MQGFAIILSCLCAGELINFLLSTPIPAPIYGLLALLVWLGLDRRNQQSIDSAGSLLLNHVALFIIPAGVAITSVFQVIAKDAFAMVIALILSTIASMVVCAKVAEFVQMLRRPAAVHSKQWLS
jgi:holin-like protein